MYSKKLVLQIIGTFTLVFLLALSVCGVASNREIRHLNKQIQDEKIEQKALRKQIEILRSERAILRYDLHVSNSRQAWYKEHYLKTLAELDDLKSIQIPELKRRKEEVAKKLEQLEKELGINKKDKQQSVPSRGGKRISEDNSGGGTYLGEFEATAY